MKRDYPPEFVEKSTAIVKYNDRRRFSAPGHKCPKVMKNYNFSTVCAAENYEGAMHSSSNGDSDDIFC